MSSILDRVKAGEILVSDGAWGTYLHAKGLKTGECPEYWNVSHPDEILNIAQSYIDAGADMIETNSFGANKFKLSHYGMESHVYNLNKVAAEISRRAAGSNHFVLGSVGSTGKLLLMEEITSAEIYAVFREQVIALEEGGADAILIETMTDLEEALLAVRAAKENTRCDVFCTMTFEKTAVDEFRTMMGVSPEEMVERLVEAGADIIGANCGNGSEDMITIVKKIRNYNRSIPVLIQANAGVPVYCDGKIKYPETPEQMAVAADKLIAAGVNIIGGCCGTTPLHIAKIAEKVRLYNH